MFAKLLGGKVRRVWVGVVVSVHVRSLTGQSVLRCRRCPPVSEPPPRPFLEITWACRVSWQHSVSWTTLQRCFDYRLVRTKAVHIFCWKWKKTTPPNYGRAHVWVCVCVWRERKREVAMDADRSNEREEMETPGESSSSSQMRQLFFSFMSVSREGRPITAAVCRCNPLRQRLSVLLCHCGDLGT